LSPSVAFRLVSKNFHPEKTFIAKKGTNFYYGIKNKNFSQKNKILRPLKIRGLGKIFFRYP